MKPHQLFVLMMIGKNVILLMTLMVTPLLHSAPHIPCIMNPEQQKARSLEINQLKEADQKDRVDWYNKTEEEKDLVTLNDLKRRTRIGEIFGEGCFYTAKDYINAALIFQHGDSPDHYYQAFIWSNKSAQLGNTTATNLAALAIDRYLLNINKKQLFGSQAYKFPNSECFCMPSVESSFPDSFRQEFAGFTLNDKINGIASLNEGKNCPILECNMPLDDTPKGSIPGFW